MRCVLGHISLIHDNRPPKEKNFSDCIPYKCELYNSKRILVIKKTSGNKTENVEPMVQINVVTFVWTASQDNLHILTFTIRLIKYSSDWRSPMILKYSFFLSKFLLKRFVIKHWINGGSYSLMFRKDCFISLGRHAGSTERYKIMPVSTILTT